MDPVTEIASALFSAFGELDTSHLRYHPEVRELCRGNTCRNYNTSWACPPAVGSLEECQQRVEQFSRFLLFSQVYPLTDSFDLEGMRDGLLDFKERTDQFGSRLQPHLGRYLLLSNEGCGRCKQCTWPDAPCRFPHKLHHSLEGYGFIVNELAVLAGIPYHNGPNTVTFFGALLY
jgi:predicted metal-binding protein